MGWLKKKFKQLKKKLKKVLSTKWGRILGMVGMYFAMGAATKAFTNWWGSLGKAGTVSGQTAAVTVEGGTGAVGGELVTKEAIAQGALKDTTTFLADMSKTSESVGLGTKFADPISSNLTRLQTSANKLTANALTGTNQEFVNSAISKLDLLNLDSISQGKSFGISIQPDITTAIKTNLPQIETLKLPDINNIGKNLQSNFTNVDGISIQKDPFTVPKFDSAVAPAPTTTTQLPSVGTGPDKLNYQDAMDDFAKWDTTLEKGKGGYTRWGDYEPTFGERLSSIPERLKTLPRRMAGSAGEYFTSPDTYKAIVPDMIKGVGTSVVINKIVGDPERPAMGGVAQQLAGELPSGSYVSEVGVQPVSATMASSAVPYQQLATQIYPGTGQLAHQQQVLAGVIPFPYQYS